MAKDRPTPDTVTAPTAEATAAAETPTVETSPAVVTSETPAAPAETIDADFETKKKRYVAMVDRGVDYRGKHHRALDEFDALPEEIEETRDFKVGFIHRVEPAPPATGAGSK